MKTTLGHTVTALAILLAGVSDAPAQSSPIYTVANNGIGSQVGIFAGFSGSNYLVGLQGDGTTNTTAISAQLISTNGGLIGAHILVGRQGTIPFAAAGTTNYVLVWSDSKLVASGGNDQIYGQFVSRSGGLTGNPFTFGPTSEEQDMQGGGGSLLASDGRNFLAVWDTGVAHDAPSGDVHGALFTPTGALVVPVMAITSGAYAALTPAVAFGKTSYLVVWNNRRVDANELYDIYGEFISTNGAQGNAFTISRTPTPTYNPCAVAFDGTNFLVVWNRNIATNATVWNIYGREVSANGTFPGSEAPMVTDANFPVLPSLAFGGSSYLMAWYARSASQTMFQFFTPAGISSSSEFNLFSPQGTNAPTLSGVLFDGARFEINAVVGVPTGNGSAGINFSSSTGTYATFLTPNFASLPPVILSTPHLAASKTNFVFQLSGPAGTNCVLQVSTNLVNWTSVSTSTIPVSGSVSLTNAMSGSNRRFYRVVP